MIFYVRSIHDGRFPPIGFPQILMWEGHPGPESSSGSLRGPPPDTRDMPKSTQISVSLGFEEDYRRRLATDNNKHGIASFLLVGSNEPRAKQRIVFRGGLTPAPQSTLRDASLGARLFTFQNPADDGLMVYHTKGNSKTW